MEKKKTFGTGLFDTGLIWFGAAVSVAEILTGTFLAPLGFGKGLAAIILGHVIGCALLFFAAYIGSKT
ncbi:MAG: cytosine permease, partial [Clostridiales Family XIII bacterium]|nr:cytosine permease [Clostridiales Family XIII bacterium]